MTPISQVLNQFCSSLRLALRLSEAEFGVDPERKVAKMPHSGHLAWKPAQMTPISQVLNQFCSSLRLALRLSEAEFGVDSERKVAKMPHLGHLAWKPAQMTPISQVLNQFCSSLRLDVKLTTSSALESHSQPSPTGGWLSLSMCHTHSIFPYSLFPHFLFPNLVTRRENLPKRPQIRTLSTSSALHVYSHWVRVLGRLEANPSWTDQVEVRKAPTHPNNPNFHTRSEKVPKRP